MYFSLLRRKTLIFGLCAIFSLCCLTYLIGKKDNLHIKILQEKSDEEEIDDLAIKRPNLPVQFWYKRLQFQLRLNDTCALFPNILMVHHVHELWQMLESSQGNIKMLGAYLDDRTGIHTVRVLAMIDKQAPVQMTAWCQLWFHDSRQPSIVPVEEYFYLWHERWGQKKDGEYQAYLLSCRLPSDLSYGVPSSVSLVENYCDNATNSLKVIYQKPGKKKGFAVCTKGDNFKKDMTVRFVEWIELLVLLGVEKIYAFDIFVNPRIQKLYDYYAAKGYVHVTPMKIPDLEVNEPFFQHMRVEHDKIRHTQVITLNYCYLQHMYEYEYIIVADTDEVIMPKGGLTSYRELVNKVAAKAAEENKTVGSFEARNSYFFDNFTLRNVRRTLSEGAVDGIDSVLSKLHIPDFMHMSQHLFRSTNISRSGSYGKSIHSTESVVAVHNHFHFKVLDPQYVSYAIPLEDGFMHHYRSGCQSELKSVCYEYYQQSFVFEDSILTFYEELKTNVLRALNDLGYLQ